MKFSINIGNNKIGLVNKKHKKLKKRMGLIRRDNFSNRLIDRISIKRDFKVEDVYVTYKTLVYDGRKSYPNNLTIGFNSFEDLKNIYFEIENNDAIDDIVLENGKHNLETFMQLRLPLINSGKAITVYNETICYENETKERLELNFYINHKYIEPLSLPENARLIKKRTKWLIIYNSNAENKAIFEVKFLSFEEIKELQKIMSIDIRDLTSEQRVRYFNLLKKAGFFNYKYGLEFSLYYIDKGRDNYVPSEYTWGNV